MKDIKRFVGQVTGLREEMQDLRESVEQQTRAMVALRARATLLCHNLELAAPKVADEAARSAVASAIAEARRIQFTIGSPGQAAELAAAAQSVVDRLEALAKKIGVAPGSLQDPQPPRN